MLDRQPSPLADAARRATVGQMPKVRIKPALTNAGQDRRRTIGERDDFKWSAIARRTAARGLHFPTSHGLPQPGFGNIQSDKLAWQDIRLSTLRRPHTRSTAYCWISTRMSARAERKPGKETLTTPVSVPPPLTSPAAVGVPEISPVEEFNERPAWSGNAEFPSE